MNAEQSHLDYIAARKAVEDRRRARAAENLSDHVYTQLAAGNGVEVWRCKDPRSTFYAFDIMMTRFGIAIVGDTENMTFTVGNSYGMEFLAGKDIEYYIHSKLDAKCKEVEFDEENWRDLLIKGACARIEEISSDEEAERWPAWVRQTDLQTREIYSEVMAFADSMRETESDLSWTNLYDSLMGAEDINYVEAAMEFVRDFGEDLNLDDTEQSSIEKTRESVYGNLYMISHAAKAIMAIKALAVPVEGAAA